MNITTKRFPTALIVGFAVAVAAATGGTVSRSIGGEENAPSQIATKPSLAPEFRLTDFNGESRSLRDYRGRVLVLFFGFTRCPNACPTELFKLARVMKDLGAASDRVQILFITLDPERDTPELLRGYVRAFDPRFVGLTGTPEQIDAVAESYHVMHRKEAIGDDYTIGHSTQTFVIDPLGQRRLVEPVDASVERFVRDLRQLTK